MPSVVEIVLDGPAAGGSAVGRDSSGRAVFCEGGLPGETVRVEIHSEKKRFARGRVIQILDRASDRIEPGCPTHAAGCGGCDLAHATVSLQRAMKVRVVADSLTRIGRMDPDLVQGLIGESERRPSVVAATGYRTTVRLGIAADRAGYRKRASHEIVVPSMCGVVHPLVEEMIFEGRYDESAGREVILRASVATGERLALVDGDADGSTFPADVVVTSRDELASGRQVFLREAAAARSWQISAGSFFQAGPTVATALVDAVRSAAGSVEGAVVVDAYAGIGLFGGTVGAEAQSVISIEQSSSSTADARVNLAGVPATIIESTVENWSAVDADIVIADPARAGLGVKGVRTLDVAGAARFVLVSCDTGSLGRDVGLLAECGYSIDTIQVIDAFPDTSHVETVVGLIR